MDELRAWELEAMLEGIEVTTTDSGGGAGR
jgi:hypothetical protein